MAEVELYWRELPSGSKRLYLHYSLSGKRYREKQAVNIKKSDSKDQVRTKEKLAEVLRSQKELDISFRETGIYNPTRQNYSFYSFLDSFLQEYQNADVRKYSALKLKLLQFWKHPDLMFKDVSEEFSMEFKEYLDVKLSGQTSQDYFKCFRRIIKSAVRKGLMQSNPAMHVENHNLTGQTTVKDSLDEEELKILWNTPFPGQDVLRKAALFSARTGCGEADLRILTAANFDLDKKIFWYVRQKGIRKKKKDELRKKGKVIHDKMVVVPITDTTIDMLGDLPPTGPVFPFIQTTTNGINKALERWIAAAGIKKHITFYCFRHTYGRHITAAGAHPRAIEELLGHSSYKYQRRYTNVDDLKGDVIKKLG